LDGRLLRTRWSCLIFLVGRQFFVIDGAFPGGRGVLKRRENGHSFALRRFTWTVTPDGHDAPVRILDLGMSLLGCCEAYS
jgi:hypothetical protein